MRKHKLAPILRTAYYGCKRLLGGIRHFVFSVTEYATGVTLGTSARKIRFYSLLVSPIKPKTKNKISDLTRASAIGLLLVAPGQRKPRIDGLQH